jgi:S-adenosylmethionine:tRNA ribosyltransferase-isomerase
MQHPRDIAIEAYHYELPEDKIAKHPLLERDAAQLLIWHNHHPITDFYKSISEYLPTNSLLVFNQTKVVNARLFFQKATGGKIEIFCLEPAERYRDITTAMQQQKKVYWKCLVGGASKWKNNEAICNIYNNEDLQLSATIHNNLNGSYEICFEWDTAQTFSEILYSVGQIPIPPYLNRSPQASDKHSYQTIFAKQEGSVAAPTAALHFTPRILEKLAAKNIQHTHITLHVGAGTFKPVSADTMKEHEMHPEFLEVDIVLLQQLSNHIKNNHPIIAVGTTSVRTLESLYWIGLQLAHQQEVDFQKISVSQWFAYEHKFPLISKQEAIAHIIAYLQQHRLERLVTRTQIIIAPPYEFKLIDGIVTNFHQPKSTLLLLVSAFIGNDWKAMYQYALENNYRFLSYGDGCLLLNKQTASKHLN